MRRLQLLTWALFAAFFVLFAVKSDSPNFPAYSAIIDLGLVLLAGIQFWLAAEAATARTDRIWYRISIGLFVWCLAIILRICDMALRQPSYGTLADGFWVAGYLPILSGIYLWHTSFPSKGHHRLITGLTIICIGLAIFFILLQPLLVNPHRSLLLKSLDLYYVTLDLIMLGFLAMPARQSRAWGARFLMCAVVVFLGSDILFSHFGEHSASHVFDYLDIPYTAGDFLLALAGAAQRQRITQIVGEPVEKWAWTCAFPY